jgi:hypothetical protein
MQFIDIYNELKGRTAGTDSVIDYWNQLQHLFYLGLNVISIAKIITVDSIMPHFR